MSEKTMRGSVTKGLKSLDATAVENRVGPGTPDVNCTRGWIELKWLKRWPSNAEKSAVKLDHFTPQQRNWLRRRWVRGGNSFLLLQAGREWLLFDGLWASRWVGRVSRPELRKGCIGHWPNGMNYEELKVCLNRKTTGA